MLKKLQNFLFEWKQKKAFEKYQANNREIIFYSESYNYWPHFEQIIKHLWEDHRRKVIYLTSDQDDLIFLNPPPGVTSFYIGNGAVRTMLFVELESPLVVMTMPDLQTHYIKRSPKVKHYSYIFHSINSCHMVYRPHAFDFYDSIFSVGSHHDKEIRSLENYNKSAPKKIIKHGYARLEALVQEYNSEAVKEEDIDKIPKILIAPSWGKNALLERHGGDFIKPLLDANLSVTLRPHPETIKNSAEILKNIANNYREYENFKIESEVVSKTSLLEADLMISDYSGAALEFAFALLKPVLFIDVPKKINNAKYEFHNLEPLEVKIRSEIGMVVTEDKLLNLVDYIYEVINKKTFLTKNISQLRQKYIYNFGQSGKVAANELIKLAN
jgi:YidC/Oxa1 family membrane protein insertase